MERVLSMLGLALKAGSVVVGEEPVGAMARAKKARIILVAHDAAPSSQRRALSFAAVGACLCLTIPADKDEMGLALGRSSCAMCAVTDILFAQAVVSKLEAMDPQRYHPAAEALADKARRALERRQEQARHKRNLQRGIRRPHAETAAVMPEETIAPPAEPPEQPPRPPRSRTQTHRQGEERAAQHGGRPPRAGDNAHSVHRSPRAGGEKPYGRSGESKTPHSGARSFQNRTQPAKPRFAGSLPVKKGKGSKKK